MGTALIIDDSSTEREILTGFLKEAGYTILTATSGEEALDKLNSGTFAPQIILLDVVLPGMSGFEVCRNLKSQENTKKIPVILCSTKGSDMDKFWGKKQGADDYIPKPVDKDLLLQTIRNLVGR